ncbi:MAG TPA: acyclic terpene utilization AtuA family protein [Nevskiaceae bacterium]|nr:acyclic terpene utilization AtuA family protein [Nevskiaceae bacterium]
MANKQMVRVANGQGFWGDSLLGPLRLVDEGPIDYLTLDYLSEVTMSIMQKLKSRDPNAGYATDFVQLLARILPKIKAKGIKVVANAAGVNGRACLAAIKKVAAEQGIKGLRVGIIEGDDIFADVDRLMAGGEAFKNMDGGGPLSKVRDRLTSANVYIGAKPIADALDQGADIVVAGRITDPSLALGPLIHEFGWSMTDYDLLARGTVAGHIMECGAQCTGGNFSRWREVPNFAHIGYPVSEVHPDGSFVVTKHEGTGGLVTVDTVSSQLLYEMGDPHHYLGPDCTVDFTTLKIAQDGENRVRISDVKGSAPTDTYKVSMTYADGYKIASGIVVTGPDAVERARLCADIVFERLAMHGAPVAPENRFVEIFGTNVCYKGIVAEPKDPGEVLLRIGARGPDRKKLDILGREMAPLVTSGPPGLTGFAAGRARATEVFGYWPALMDKTKISTRVTVEEV